VAASLITRLRHRLAALAVKAVQRLGRRDVRVLGKTYRVTPAVFNPRHFGTSRFMARHIEAGPNDAVLDMGTGCGIQAIVAAGAAGRVVAADVNPEAVRCARENVAACGLADRVAVVESDLFAALDPAERFTVILFTPPYLEGTPRSAFDRALYDPGKALLRRFFADAPAFLAPGGTVQMIYSSIADIPAALAIAGELGWRHTLIAERRFFGERLAIYRLALGRPAGAMPA